MMVRIIEPSAYPNRLIKVLSIAGSDPSGGAGIQVDLKVFQALGAYGMVVPAALTSQNSKGVTAVHPVGMRSFKQQVETLLADISPHAVKTGMLLMPGTVRTTAKALSRHGIRNVVVDPVLRSTSGNMMLRPEGVGILLKELLPFALIVTPNIPEAEILARMKIRNARDMDHAAGRIMDLGPKFVLIKGGHRTGPAVDTLYGGKTVWTFSTPRRNGEYHGTGCVLSSAITVFIARGFTVEKAVEKAKQYVDGMLTHALPIGNGTVKYFQFRRP